MHNYLRHNFLFSFGDKTQPYRHQNKRPLTNCVYCSNKRKIWGTKQKYSAQPSAKSAASIMLNDGSYIRCDIK